MKEYTVTYEGKFSVTYTVEADNAEEAQDRADQIQDGVTQYCGNGGCEHLIGVDGYAEGKPTIEAYEGLEQIDVSEV